MKNMIALVWILSLFGCVTSPPEGKTNASALVSPVGGQEKNAFEIVIEDTTAIPQDLSFSIYEFKGGKNLVPIASSAKGSKGTYTIQFPKATHGIYNLGNNLQNSVTVFIDSTVSKQRIRSKVLYPLATNYTVEGSEVSIQMQSFLKEMVEHNNEQQRMQQLAKTIDPNDIGAQKDFKAKYAAFSKAFQQKRKTFIDKNMGSPALLMAVSTINPQTELPLLKKVVSQGLAKSIPGSMHLKSVSDYLNSYINKANQVKIEPGIQAPDINLPNLDGSFIKLSSLKGKVVLLDFWASWCGPCRKENPNVVALYNKYKNKGFEIYSVSLDKDKGRWENAIKQDGLIWPSHVSDLKGWSSAGGKVYGISSIPYTVLLDKTGKIVQIGLRGPALEQAVSKLL